MYGSTTPFYFCHSFLTLPVAMFAANVMAEMRLDGLAMPFPAISYAVPWSTDVRIIGSPKVTLTASKK